MTITKRKVRTVRVFYWCRGAKTSIWVASTWSDDGKEIERFNFGGDPDHVWGGFQPTKEKAIDKAYQLCLKNKLGSFDLVVDSYGAGGKTEKVYVTAERLMQRRMLRRQQ